MLAHARFRWTIWPLVLVATMLGIYGAWSFHGAGRTWFDGDLEPGAAGAVERPGPVDAEHRRDQDQRPDRPSEPGMGEHRAGHPVPLPNVLGKSPMSIHAG